MKKKLLFLLLFFLIYSIYSQKKNAEKSFYSSFDKIVGLQNTDLSYGVTFKEKYRKINGSHNYFLKDQFITGDITYRGDSYFNVKLKYELVEDIVVLNIRNNHHNVSIILEKELISKFSIHNLNFVNTIEHGFLEKVISKESFSIYKKHKKQKIGNTDRKYFYHTFEKKEKNLLFYKNKYHFIKSKRDFIKIFPTNRKLITKFYAENRFLLKKDLKNFIIKLMNKLLIELKNE